MKLTTTQILQILTWLAGVAPELAHLLPAKYAHMVLGAAGFISLLLTQHAGNRNPDGTPAAVAYQKPTSTVPTGTGAALLLAFLLFAPRVQAQDFVAAGAQFNGTTVTPFGAYAHSLGSGIYSIESVQVTQIHVQPQITFQTVTTQDFGYDFSTWLLPATWQKRLSLLGIGGAGASASSAALGSAFDGGGLAVIHTSKIDIALGARIIKTTQAGTQTIPVVAATYRWQ